MAMQKPAGGPAPYPVKVIANPTQDELRKLTLEHTPSVIETAHGNICKISRNKARMAQYTYLLYPESEKANFSGNLLDPARGRELIELQTKYIKEKGQLISIQGYIGIGEHAFATEWFYTLEGANIAAMQQVLTFPREDVETPEQLAKDFDPILRVVYTPDCFAKGMPGEQAILVDLENATSYIMGPDYFGESKKAALRMLNDYVYEKGGLVLHAGAKAVTKGADHLTMTVMGLSGTGKTTTTFSKQGELTQPIQDDMVVLWPGGGCSITENGCFAKTQGLTDDTEPVIYRGTLDPTAWVENVYVDEAGKYDFFKTKLTPAEVGRTRDILIQTGANAANVDKYIKGEVSYDDVVDDGITKDGWDFVQWSQNGRSIIPMRAIEDAADLHNIPPIQSMGILNRDEGPDAATPGIVRFTSPEQAAGYFMLGETTKTSAAGKERGKTRSPFTQPFFPRAFGLQAVRFKELAAGMGATDMWMMNTGYIGGDQKDVDAGRALKVKIRHSSAMLEALLTDHAKWKKDPDYGYDIVDVDAPENAELLEKVPAEILNPALFFEKNGKSDLYRDWVKRMKSERKAFLESFDVDPAIVKVIAG